MTVKDIELNDLKRDVDFSVDLLVQVRKHLTFLRALHNLGITTQYLNEAPWKNSILGRIFRIQLDHFRGSDTAFVNESIRRYAELWLPLVAVAHERNQKNLIPPPDIAWMWHCHRLAPYRYIEHVKGVFGGILVDASHPFVFQTDTDTYENSNSTWPIDEKENYMEIARITRDLFDELYPSDSFFGVSVTNKEKEGKPDEHPTCRFLSGYDILSACQRQTTFLWQVSGPRFSQDFFQREGIENYRRFIKLTNHPMRNPNTWLVPTYQIDCLWHTHILSNIQAYDSDVKSITDGAILDHDDSLNDRSEGGVLDTSFQQTEQLWRDVYELDYVVTGGMYRGEPPHVFYLSHLKRANKEDELRESDPLASQFSNEWMPNDHPLAFVPCKFNQYNTLSTLNRYKDGYVLGRGDKGLGYYHINTHQGNRVLIERCKRKSSEKWSHFALYCLLCLYLAMNIYGFFDSVFNADDVADDKDNSVDWLDEVGWFLYILFSFFFAAFVVRGSRTYLKLLRQTLEDAEHRSQVSGPSAFRRSRLVDHDADAMEEGIYTLCDDDVPTARETVGPAACGFLESYHHGTRRSRGRVSASAAANCGGAF